MITRQTAAYKIIDYLCHRITLAELVDRAENAMMDGGFDEKDHDKIRDIISSLGLADVKEFEITWEEWTDFLKRLGYQVDLRETSKSKIIKA